MKGIKKNKVIRKNRINNEIQSQTVRLTGVQGEKLGIVTLQDALDKSFYAGLDLVEISPNAEPPVCKIMDYGKFLYKKNKLLKEQKKKQKIIQIKEIKFRPSTEKGDYQIKLRNIKRFLIDGNKVKITLRFRGREMAHQNIGIQVLKKIQNDLLDIAIVDFFPSKIEGRQMIMILSSKKK
ncbi:translation initiation factor IF-3 [Buchnera aphidicola (Mollitrichosiphum nigrofasciatum)]|uniref:translation initiation factor IF-3 n=1 Tax=Buchnera aphidicola TaxID=9 RepID=UPI0031B8A6FC